MKRLFTRRPPPESEADPDLERVRQERRAIIDDLNWIKAERRRRARAAEMPWPRELEHRRQPERRRKS
jgi:hypothetical protein